MLNINQVKLYNPFYNQVIHKDNSTKPDVQRSEANIQARLSLDNLKANFLSFGKMPEIGGYNYIYDQKGKNHNGKGPDFFVYQKITEHFSESKGVKVLDLGAGTGRNTIPLAMEGFNVTAVEPSQSGMDIIDECADKKGVKDRVKTVFADILEPEDIKKLGRHDFASMCLITPHFTDKELSQALKNVSNALKPGGVFVFNALIRRPDYIDRNKELFLNPEEYGHMNFDQKFIEKEAQKSGFELVEEPSIYKEAEYVRPGYMKSITWGGNPSSSNNFEVDLKWFVLRKKA